MVNVGSEGKEVSISFWSFDPVTTKVVKDEDWACLSFRGESPEVLEKVLLNLIADLQEALVKVRVQKAVQKKVSEIEKEVRSGASALMAG
jgi:hypothetical protein